METGGIARAWGLGLARVIRVLAGDRVELETASGTKRVMKSGAVEMVKRPNGTAPTTQKKPVQAEDVRRTKDPDRGDGQNSPDRGHLPDEDLTETPQQHTAGSLTGEVLERMSDAELAAVLQHGYTGTYDRDTTERIAAEFDRRDEERKKGPWVEERMDAATDDLGRWLAADSLWPAAWEEWARGRASYNPDLAAEIREAYQAYIEHRYLAAEEFTRGNFFNGTYKNNWPFDPRAFFDGRVVHTDRVNKYASRELQEWFARHKPTVSFTEFKKRYLGGTPSGHQGWINEYG